MEEIYNLDYYDYKVNKKLIAQEPLKERDKARLMVIHRESGKIEHRIFRDIVDYLNKDDCLVLNNSKVIKARIIGELNGQEVEIFYTRTINENEFEGIGKPLRKLKKGKTIKVKEYEILVKEELRGKRIFFLENFMNVFEKYGIIPLPHYINRKPTKEDEVFYQTVYAKDEGSVAAPTAGLHFTKELIEQIQEKGVNVCYITLHVGIGTFKPITEKDIRKHTMDKEFYEIPDETAKIIKTSKRIIAVGTTTTRALEYWNFDENPTKGWTNLFIHPPYKFKVIHGLITNFHPPKSTPLILVSAFIGSFEKLKRAYEIAQEVEYRLFSYGDAMLIL
ncbi:MAG: tRNA preQ1(34) S-adenosylmethionine ribosyltransferase-isomerase QueA [candidate division WOR-3 bacterium]|nr:tRNA preQ1(34) S-adenosylmethionine ribosyltransferase-isomerase QueA [candidate division WOR-3 bacterium]MCX7947378.1 tRNA preQ1(34) S-adenosylmethionine ribosyltransferase-isomerase QueA [candidate division WOR-3 bacterium]MDW8150066.1 tRNA preQ1(34) S-adenosylmethionine ribosyltransferase-isomerase QueA [candidate division WOR-3 bacterium]